VKQADEIDKVSFAARPRKDSPHDGVDNPTSYRLRLER